VTKGLGHRGYIASRPVNGSRIPQHVQNLVIRDYAQRQGLRYLLSATELSPEGCFIVLQDVLSELDGIGGIILYSLFMLPADKSERQKIYDTLLGNTKTLHAAVENLTLQSEEDVVRFEEIFSVTENLEKCLQPQDLMPWTN